MTIAPELPPPVYANDSDYKPQGEAGKLLLENYKITIRQSEETPSASISQWMKSARIAFEEESCVIDAYDIHETPTFDWTSDTQRVTELVKNFTDSIDANH